MPDEPAQQTPPADAASKHQPKLPKQVQQQVDAVEAMMAEQQPPAAEEDSQEALVSSATDMPANEGVEADDGEEPPVEEETWEQRARSMAGRLDQALAANQQLSTRVSELELQASTARLYGKPQQQPEPEPVAPALIKPEEINDYGEEFFDVVGRRAKEMYFPEFEQMNRRIKQLESQTQAVGEVMQKSQKRDLYGMLYDEVPQWKEINHSPEFKMWLAYPDPFSGMKRHDLLNDAFARHDAQRVVNFFAGFLAEVQQSQGGTQSAPPLPNGQASGTGTRPAAPPLPNGQASGRPTLEDFAAPGRARSGPQTLPPDKPIYTQAQIAKLSADKMAGRYRGREAELAAIEQDIFQAQHEGRLIP